MTDVTDFASAIRFLVNARTGKPVPRKKIANNTYVERSGHTTGRGDQIREGEIGVVLHETAVVVYGPDYIRLNTGGWLTMTTRERIECYTPENIRIFSDSNARWQVRYASGDDGSYWGGASVPYYDGIALRWDESCERYAPSREDRERDTSEEDAHNAMVRRLVTRYLSTIKKGTLGEPGGVDTTFDSCALCRWTDVPTMTGPYCTTAIIPSIGDKMEDTQHLIDHMLENELPNELLLHACREVAGDMRRAEIWSSMDHQRNQCLRKFLLTRLLVGAVATKHGRRPVVMPPAYATPIHVPDPDLVAF